MESSSTTYLRITMVDGVKVINPPNFGWLERTLSRVEMDYLWNCVNNRTDSYKHRLAGNIHESTTLIDVDNLFFNNTLLPLCSEYARSFSNLGDNVAVSNSHPYYLTDFWVNYQKQNEFNPVHDHGGIYSFVVWMKIPTDYHDQNQNPIAKTSHCPLVSAFQFYYTTTLGKIVPYTYEMNPNVEGTILFFPAELNHCVYPFYNCGDDRITISGNISLNSSIVL